MSMSPLLSMPSPPCLTLNGRKRLCRASMSSTLGALLPNVVSRHFLRFSSEIVVVEESVLFFSISDLMTLIVSVVSWF